jgi:hypothetical protein
LPVPHAKEGSYYKNSPTIIDLPLELLADFPELQGLEPAASQQELQTILGRVGSTSSSFIKISPALRRKNASRKSNAMTTAGRDRQRNTHFSYLITVNHDAPVELFQEYRTDAGEFNRRR